MSNLNITIAGHFNVTGTAKLTPSFGLRAIVNTQCNLYPVLQRDWWEDFIGGRPFPIGYKTPVFPPPNPGIGDTS